MSIAHRLQKISADDGKKIHPGTKAILAGTLASAGLLGAASVGYGVKSLINHLQSAKPYLDLNALNLIRNQRAGVVPGNILNDHPMNMLTDAQLTAQIKAANNLIETKQNNMLRAGRKSALLGAAAVPITGVGLTASSEFQRVQNAREKRQNPNGSNPVNVLHGPQFRVWKYD